MDWGSFATFCALAVIVVLIPGPDFAVVTKNTLAGRRRGGYAATCGVVTSNAVQGLCAAAGLGALIARSQPVFQTIRWLGVCYLAYLAVQTLRSAWRGDYARPGEDGPVAARGYRQGFVSNITNPKVLTFYLAVLPQFIGDGRAAWALAVLALTHAVLSLAYLMALVTVLDRATRWLSRRPIRRALDAVTGVALAAFSLRLATQRI